MKRLLLALGLMLIISSCGVSSFDRLGTGTGSMGTATGSGIGFGGSSDWGYYKLLLDQGTIPPKDAVDVQGFFAYHNVDLPAADSSVPITMHTMLGLGWGYYNEDADMYLQLGFNSAQTISNIQAVPLNITVIVDKSGSMYGSRIEYVKQGLKLMLSNLTTNDYFSIVVYDTTAKTLLSPTLMKNPGAARELIDSIDADGSTALYDGMVLGYQENLKSYSTNRVNRVILLSDGQANVGVVDTASIIAASKTYNDQGVGITTIGVGSDFNYELMSGLAKESGGNFYFLENESKVTQVLSDELDFVLTPIAKNLVITFKMTGKYLISDTYGLTLKTNEQGYPYLKVDTVYLSKRNGVMMVKLGAATNFRALKNAKLLDISLSYEWIVYTNTNVAMQNEILFPGTNYYADGSEFVYYVKHNAIRKSMLLLNIVRTFIECSRLALETTNTMQAYDKLYRLNTMAVKENRILKDAEISNDIEYIVKFINILYSKIPR